MEEIRRRLNQLEQRFEMYLNKGSDRARELEQRIGQLEKMPGEITNIIRTLQRMENTLLKEFKQGQDLMRSMVENEWSIDNAKIQLKMEMERKEADLINAQKDFELEQKRARAEMKRDIWKKVIAIGLPILTTLATAITLLIQNFFK